MAKLNSKAYPGGLPLQATLSTWHSLPRTPPSTIYSHGPGMQEDPGEWGMGASCLPHQAPLLHLQRGPSWPPPNTCPRMHRPVPMFIPVLGFLSIHWGSKAQDLPMRLSVCGVHRRTAGGRC